jgi:hypothetical protein
MNATLPAFIQAIADNWPDDWCISVGLSPTCPDCQSDYGMDAREFYASYENGSVCDEGSLSWSACHSCGSTLGGNRYAAHAFRPGSKEPCEHISVCEDCLCFHANGDIPEEWEA